MFLARRALRRPQGGLGVVLAFVLTFIELASYVVLLRIVWAL